ncbi:hypothetical protein [Nannocystis pusilla]|uniref:Uncharacterized protein n=1 Tax=Nannocystis pusilla TaxID=889268 RepID=A0ABS7TPI2_9BACT|nr:hypothetical protein [Nannocystis pusilla]MBZ5710081.1 hypothetical protein [Nannocystis pusilla]
MPRRLSEDQRQLLAFLPDDGSAISGYGLMAQLQEAGWRTREIEHVMGELRELGEIIVGRGGSGGSIRHVRNDRRALLDAIDEFEAEGTACTRATLQSYMEWHPDYLEQVLDALLEQGRLEVGPGRRGAIARAQNEDADDDPARDAPAAQGDPAEDERHLLELIPETGAIGNTRLRNELVNRYGWDDERYWETRKRLRQRGLVEVGRGRGGSLRRVRLDTVVLTDEVPAPVEPRPPEVLRDEEMLWRRLPENGDDVELGSLQGHFQWTSTRFFAVLEQLVADQKIHWHNSKIKRLIPTPAPTEASVSLPVPPAQNQRNALYVFVLERFESTSLKRFVETALDAERVAQNIVWESNYADVVHQVCDQLRRAGYIDPQFFHLLRDHFRRLHPEIDALERLWHTPSPPGPR